MGTKIVTPYFPMVLGEVQTEKALCDRISSLVRMVRSP
jgi:hypothetical protein